MARRLGQLVQLSHGGPGLCGAVGGQHDLGVGGQQLGTGHVVVRLVERGLDRGRRSVGTTLRQAEQGQARLGVAAAGVGLAVGVLGRCQIAAQPVQLAQLVVGHPDPWVRRVGESVAGPLGVGHGCVPLAVHLQDLGSVHEALAPVGHETWLVLAPAVERPGPLSGTAQVEDLLAGVDDRAVHDAGHDGRCLASGHRHHGLVQVAHALLGVAEAQQRLAPADGAERGQVGVGEATRQVPGLVEALERGVGVTGAHRHQALRQQEVPAFDAVQVVLVDQARSAGQPAAALGHLPPLDQPEPQPERAPHRPSLVAALQPRLVRPGPRRGGLVVMAGEVRGGGQPLEVVGLQRCGTVGLAQGVVGVGPGALIEGETTRLQQLGALHGSPPPVCWSDGTRRGATPDGRAGSPRPRR